MSVSNLCHALESWMRLRWTATALTAREEQVLLDTIECELRLLCKPQGKPPMLSGVPDLDYLAGILSPAGKEFVPKDEHAVEASLRKLVEELVWRGQVIEAERRCRKARFLHAQVAFAGTGVMPANDDQVAGGVEALSNRLSRAEGEVLRLRAVLDSIAEGGWRGDDGARQVVATARAALKNGWRP